MKILKTDEELHLERPCVASIGFFDGVHLGHKFLISRVMNIAKESNLDSTIITFDQHPRQVLNENYQPQLLNTLDEKLILLSKTEVDNCALLHFDKMFAALSAREFMEEILLKKLNVRKLLIGYDNRFGHDVTESFEDYVRFGEELGIEVIKNNAFEYKGVNISSTVVRSFLQEGEMEKVEMCLGYPYTIIGKVVEGFQKGREMGFPTANLEVSSANKMVPPPGVYAVNVRLEDSNETKNGMMNIGTRPTFGGDKVTLEVNIFDFQGNLYDKMILVSFVSRIRDEQKFCSEEALAEQLKKDKDDIIKQFDK